MSPRPSAPADVAIITVSYNSSAQLADFLASAINSVASPSQITVVDNNSADINITQKLAKKLGVNLLKLNKNVGYGSAINTAVRSLPNYMDTLLICNPDTLLNPETVVCLKATSNLAKVGAVGPKILNDEGEIYPSARSFPSLINGIGHAIFSLFWKENPWTARYLTSTHLQTQITQTDWVSGSCIGIRKKVFEEVGGFDSKYFMYFEDVDLAYRLNEAGYRNQFNPHVFVIHKGGQSTKNVKKSMQKIHHQSARLFIKTRYPGFKWALLRAFLYSGLFFRELVVSAKSKDNPGGMDV